MCESPALLLHLDKLHTTELGLQRIRKNLALGDIGDAVKYCAERIQSPGAHIERRGKNWYIHVQDEEITVNAHSYTIITAHKC